MTVYVLQHTHEIDDDREDVKLIGVYSSQPEALAAAARLSNKPGFESAPDGFHVDAYELDADHWVAGYSDGQLVSREGKISTMKNRQPVG